MNGSQVSTDLSRNLVKFLLTRVGPGGYSKWWRGVVVEGSAVRGRLPLDGNPSP